MESKEVQFTVSTKDETRVIELGATPSKGTIGMGVKNGEVFIGFSDECTAHQRTGDSLPTDKPSIPHTVLLFKSKAGVEVLQRCLDHVKIELGLALDDI